jgi:hypothetical protein
LGELRLPLRHIETGQLSIVRAAVAGMVIDAHPGKKRLRLNQITQRPFLRCCVLSHARIVARIRYGFVTSYC